MINPQLIANAATNLTKNELPKTSKNDFNTKENALTGALKKNLGLANTSTKLISVGNEDLNLKLNNLVNKILDQLFAKSSPNEKLINQGDKLNFAPNFSNEIKFLVSEMKKSDIFGELLGKLEQILKPASEVKADNLAPLFKNSGVFFEAKLKDALNPETLPKSFHNLLNAIKSLSSPKIAGQIIALATKDLDPQSSLNELKNILKAQKDENTKALQNTNFKTLLSLNTKLENFKNYISKNPNFAQSNIKELATSILKQLNTLESNFKQELARPENLTFKDTKFLKDLHQSFNQLINTLKAFSKGDFSALSKANLPNNPTQSNAPTQKVSFAESQTMASETENLNEPNSTSSKDSLKTNEKPSFNEIKTENETKTQKPENNTQNSQNNKTNTQSESPKATPHTKTSEEPPSNTLKTSNQPQEAPKQESIQQKPTLVNSNENDSPNETLTKNTAENTNKSDLAKPNQPHSSKTKENVPSKSDTNTTNTMNKTAQEKPNTPMPTQTNPSENKILQDKTMPLNEQQRLPQNETLQVKNLIFTTEKTQMPELEHLNKELNTLLRRTNESLKQLDSGAQNAKTNLADIKNLEHKIERATKDLAQIVPKNGDEISSELKNDIKSTLFQVSNLAKNEGNEAIANQANRLLAQIEFNQLMSLANDSINTYLPLFWEDLNESKVIFKRGKKDKYFAQIKLHFEKLGELDILIALKQDKYLDINIMAENKAFRKAIYEHSHELRRALSKAGLLSSNFFVGDIIRSKLAPQDTGRNYEFQMGVDKKA